MIAARPPSAPPPDAAVLLALLPASAPNRAGPSGSAGALAALQQQLGEAVRVLCLDASTHASVVSSFYAARLPCFVLVRHGIELWRECGWPDAATVVPLLLGKLGSRPAVPTPETTPRT